MNNAQNARSKASKFFKKIQVNCKFLFKFQFTKKEIYEQGFKLPPKFRTKTFFFHHHQIKKCPCTFSRFFFKFMNITSNSSSTMNQIYNIKFFCNNLTNQTANDFKVCSLFRRLSYQHVELLPIKILFENFNSPCKAKLRCISAYCIIQTPVVNILAEIPPWRRRSMRLRSPGAKSNEKIGGQRNIQGGMDTRDNSGSQCLDQWAA